MRKSILVLTLSLVFLSISSVAHGASSSLVIRPNGDSTAQWTPTPSGTHYTTVDEAAASDADYVKENILNQKDEWTMEDVSGTIPSGATIDSVLLTERGKSLYDDLNEVQSGRKAGLKVGSDTTWGTERTNNTLYTTYTQKLSAPGGRTWSRNNLDSLVVSVIQTTTAAPYCTVYTSQAYVTVYYTSYDTSPITKSAGLGADRAGVGTITWATPTNIYTSNDAYATATYTSGWISRYLNASAFGFAIGPDQQIDGIKVEIEKKASCFTGDTKILTPSGYKLIKDLKEKDLVYGFDEKYNLKPAEILKTSQHIVSEYLKIKTENQSVEVTEEHPFFTPKGLVKAGDLKIGDEVFLLNGIIETIISKKVIKQEIKVYDLTVNGYHNYFANNFAVHNKGSTYISDSIVSIVKADNSIGATNYMVEDAWSTSDAYSTYGGATDKWGETWTPTDINNANFGVVISVWGGGSAVASIDHIRITVYHSLDTSPPDTVKQVDTTAVTTTSVSLKCHKNDSTDCVGYKVMYKAGATPPDSQNQAGITYGDSSDANGRNDTLFTVSGLSVNTQYSFSIFAKDYVPIPNWTKKGTTSYKTRYTKASAPSAPATSNPDSNTIDVTVHKNGNPTTTNFAIWVTPAVGGKNYVQIDGSINTSAAWQDSATWGTKTVTGLSSSTTYYFKVKARNEDGTETAFGDSSHATTIPTGYLIILSDNFNDNSLDANKWVERSPGGTSQAKEQNKQLELYLNHTAHCGAGVYTKNKYIRTGDYTLIANFQANYDSAAASGYDGIWILRGDTSGTNFWDEYYGSPTTGLFVRIGVGCNYDNDGVGIYYDNDLGWECGWDTTVAQNTANIIDTSSTSWYAVKFKFNGSSGLCSLWVDNSLKCTGTLGSSWLSDLGDSVRFAMHSSQYNTTTKLDKYDTFVLLTPFALSISASPTTWDLDTLNPSQIKTMVTGEKIKVKNTGNVAEQLSLKIDTMDTKGEWSCSNLANGQGVNTYVMSGIFAHKDSTLDSSDFNSGNNGDVIDTTTQWASSDTFALGTQAVGANVTVNDSLYLWLQMKMPTTASGSKADSTRNIIIQIGCQQAP